MAIETQIPKEIKDFEEKLIFNLTLRKLVIVIIASGICIPTYIFSRPYVGDDVASWFVIIVAMILIPIGWFKKNGMNFEHYLKAMLIFRFVLPKMRRYKISNFFEELEKSQYQKFFNNIDKRRKKVFTKEVVVEMNNQIEINGERIDEDMQATERVKKLQAERLKKNNQLATAPVSVTEKINDMEAVKNIKVKIKDIYIHRIGAKFYPFGVKAGWTVFPIIFKETPYVVDFKIHISNLDDLKVICSIYGYGYKKKLVKKHKRNKVFEMECSMINLKDDVELDMLNIEEPEFKMHLPAIIEKIFAEFDVYKNNEEEKKNKIREVEEWNGIL